jgi:hypothetical protein
MHGSIVGMTLAGEVLELKPLTSTCFSPKTIRKLIWNGNRDSTLRDGRLGTYFFYFTKHPVGSGPPRYRGFTITLRHTTVGSVPLDERSARRREQYLTTHNTHKRQISMLLTGFEPAIPASERPQTNASDRKATGTSD